VFHYSIRFVNLVYGFRAPFVLLVFISILFISCEKEQVSGARVTVNFPETDSLAVKIYHQPVLEDEILAQLDLDSPNYGFIQLELSKPLVSHIAINGTSYELYLSRAMT
jgi:hypothetical protein